ncbi:gluconate 2-dehydrogenase subunit 3 family protein [Rhizobium sp.]|uniref:gluconate 2-dehydrogenase subunit 3 family protein n=1 Tax=Rhizobium sp. TaxID=391 RepID=UPI00289935DE
MSESGQFRASRRWFLSSVAATMLVGTTGSAFGRTFSGSLPWKAASADPPVPISPGGWRFFTEGEGRLVSAIVDRLIPADDLSISGKDAGCAVYIDRQLAGDYGSSSRLYTKGPFLKGIPQQGYQGQLNPSELYRRGLAAITRYVFEKYDGKAFGDLSPEQQDSFLTELEADHIELPDGVGGKEFFGFVLNNTMEGFFADPVYGGNKDMVSWKMLGFPGARYDYRDHVSKHNEPYPHPPVSILGAMDWASK